MQASLETQIYALAGLCQAAKLVQKVARSTDSQQAQLEIILNSVINLNPATPLDIYGGDLTNLREGLQLIIDQLGDTPKKDVELTRYLVGVLALERRLNKNRDNMAELGKQLSGPIYQALAGGDASALDSSTQALIQAFLQQKKGLNSAELS